jgi:hypothetical protein
MMYRQGDVVSKKIEQLDESEIEILKRDEQQRIVLAYGEVTGHAHAIKSKSANLFKAKNLDKFFLIVSGEVDLSHEEHSTIKIPEGKYEIKRQREYRPAGIIQVAD